jgi:hypothetical protein
VLRSGASHVASFYRPGLEPPRPGPRHPLASPAKAHQSALGHPMPQESPAKRWKPKTKTESPRAPRRPGALNASARPQQTELWVFSTFVFIVGGKLRARGQQASIHQRPSSRPYDRNPRVYARVCGGKMWQKRDLCARETSKTL